MASPLYLAMTAAEFQSAAQLPPKLAWMACHFSPYGTGLSNLPGKLPPGSMLIVNDRTPICGHDPKQIAKQLADAVNALRASSVLLDFQRPDCSETAELAKVLVSGLPCPVGVSEMYARGLDCPVFLPPVPADCFVGEYFLPWQGREIWLETAPAGQVITVTEKGAAAASLPCAALPETGFRDETLLCHYKVEAEDSAKFTLWRTREDLEDLMRAAQDYHVTQFVGLFQELSQGR